VTGEIAEWSGLVVAALGGAAIGVERQRSGHASGAHAHLGGVRTFTLLGGLAGIAGWFARAGWHGIAVVIASGAVALIVAGYVAASRRDVDATTEVAALVVIAAGVLAGFGRLSVASGVIAITALLLIEKSRVHALVARLDDVELQAAARFGVMAVVILPLLPEGPFGPFGGVKPRALWLLVLFFAGLSFTGYLARRMFGAAQGYPLAGALGGLISSTNVTYTFARLSRREPALSHALAVGTIGACTVLFARVLVATLVLNRSVARALFPCLVAPFVLGVVALIMWSRSHPDEAGDPRHGTPTNPLQVWPALQMAATFQAVLYAVHGMHQLLGDAGLLLSGAVLGISDVDALTISMAQSASAGVAPGTAAQAIVAGILANSVLKIGLVVVLGTRPFKRRSAIVLAAMALALVASFRALR
jgi:uncharacterized membrane protein (DUF4010 family)